MIDNIRSPSRSNSVGEFIRYIPGDLPIDAVSLSDIIPVGRRGYGLSGSDLLTFTRRCLFALLRKGARPVMMADNRSGCAVVERFGHRREEIAERVISEWLAVGAPEPRIQGPDPGQPDIIGPRGSDPHLRIKMSLRLWSDSHDLSNIVHELGRPPLHAYKKGEVVHVGRQGKPRVPERHYVSYPDAEALDFGDVEPWLSSELDLIEKSKLTGELIRSGIVEAVLWVAIFGAIRIEHPAIRSEIVERVRSMGLRIFVENYSSDPIVDGEDAGLHDEEASPRPKIPTKTWYPA